MTLAIMPDGMVIDHVAEFIYGDTKRIRRLYEQDRAAYVDAIARLFQALVTHQKIYFGRAEPKTTATAKLREMLVEAGRVEWLRGLDPEVRQERRSKAWRVLREEWWEQIAEALTQEPRLLEALCGHAGRESRYYFNIEPDPSWNADHYVSEDEALRLPDRARDRLTAHVQNVLASSGKETKSGEVRVFVDRTFTTHYLTFCEHWHFNGDQYLPGYTRGNLLFLWRGSDKSRQRLDFAAECFAADVVDGVKDRGECLSRLMDWLDSKKGQKAVNNLSDLEIALQTADSDWRDRWAEEVKRAFGLTRASEGVAHRAVYASANLLGGVLKAVGGSLAEGFSTAAQGVPALDPRIRGNYRWTLQLPVKDRATIARRTRELLS